MLVPNGDAFGRTKTNRVKCSNDRNGVTRKQTDLVTVYFPKPLQHLAFTELKRRKYKRVLYSFLSKFRQLNNTEKYSSGRRGVTRNLVGRESVAWVQIPPSPPSWIYPNPRKIPKNKEALPATEGLFCCANMAWQNLVLAVKFLYGKRVPTDMGILFYRSLCLFKCIVSHKAFSFLIDT